MVKKRKYIKNSTPQQAGDEIFRFLEKIGGKREKGLLSGLWENWTNIMGEEVANDTVEIMAKEQTLLLKTHDAMSMQELNFHKDYILERANNFLGSQYFTKISLII